MFVFTIAVLLMIAVFAAPAIWVSIHNSKIKKAPPKTVCPLCELGDKPKKVYYFPIAKRPKSVWDKER